MSILLLVICIWKFTGLFAAITMEDPTVTVVVLSKSEDTVINSVIQNLKCSSNFDSKLSWTLSGTDSSFFSVSVDLTDKQKAKLLLTKNLDYETGTHKQFTLTVSDTDETIAIDFKITVTDVFDIVPTFSNASYSCVIPENTVNGCTMVAVSDVETTHTPPDTVTCTLTGVGSNYFKVASNTCLITPLTAFDRESLTVPTSFTGLTITAIDKGGKSSTAKISIVIEDKNDNTPVCETFSTSFTKSEKFDGNLVKFTCTDKDSGRNSLLSCSSDNSDISTTMSGTECSVDINTAIKFETFTPNPKTINLKVSDNPVNYATRNELTIPITLTITDIIGPVFLKEPYLCQIEEETRTPCKVVQVRQEHSDGITCTLFGQNSNYFSILSPNCEITPIDAIDYDDQTTPNDFPFINVKAMDKDGKFNYARVNITIIDTNDNIPVCNPTTHLETRSEIFTGLVNTIKCTDKDSGRFGELTCNATDSRVKTSMNGLDCLVSIQNPVDYEELTIRPVAFKVIVQDKPEKITDAKFTTISYRFVVTETPEHTYIPTVLVVITDENDNPPSCEPRFVSKKVTNKFTGEVSKIICSDKDSGKNAELSCTTTESKIAVTMSDTECTVSVKKAIDIDTLKNNTLTFSILVRDNPKNETSVKETNVSFTITVQKIPWYKEDVYIAILVIGILLLLIVLAIVLGCYFYNSGGQKIADSSNYIKDEKEYYSNSQPISTDKVVFKTVFQEYNPYGA